MWGNNAKDVVSEIAVLKTLSHPNIVLIIGTSLGHQHFHIIMELIDGYDLQKITFNYKIKMLFKLTTEGKTDIFRQVSLALEFMHNHFKCFIHCDIKPGNILVNFQRRAKVADLGLSTVKNMCSQYCSTKGKKKFVGTPAYMSPEVYSMESSPTIYSDMWSLGATVVEMYSELLIWDYDKHGDLDDIFLIK